MVIVAVVRFLLLGFHRMALMGATLYTVILNEIAINERDRERTREKENIENKLKFMLVWENENRSECGQFWRNVGIKNTKQ